MLLGRLRRRNGAGVFWDEERIFAFFPRIKQRWRSPADYLSGGEQQMLHAAGQPVRPVPLIAGCAILITVLGGAAVLRDRRRTTQAENLLRTLYILMEKRGRVTNESDRRFGVDDVGQKHWRKLWMKCWPKPA